MASILKVRGIERLSTAELKALVSTAKMLNINPDWLATVISFESAGSFSPSKLNAAGSGAFGLIQFMPWVARNILGTATDAQAAAIGKAMSFTEQLQRMVIPYFKGRTMRSLEDVYLQVFYPAAAGKPDDWVVAREGSAVYRQNAGFDKAKKGWITRRDITSTIRAVADAANGARIQVGSVALEIVGSLAACAAIFFGYQRYWKTGKIQAAARPVIEKVKDIV